MIVHIAPNHMIDGLWHKAGALLQKACDKVPSDVTVADLWQMCRSGNAYLMVAVNEEDMEMAAVFQFQRYENEMVLKCLCLGGSKREEWAEMAQEKAFEMAKDGGAKRVVYQGRKGWEKVFPGLKVVSYIYEIEV